MERARALETVGPEADRRRQRPDVGHALPSRSRDSSTIHTWTLQRSARAAADERPDAHTSSATLLGLQRSAGNAAVADWMNGAGLSAPGRPVMVQRAPDHERAGGPGPGGTWYRPPGPSGHACCDALTAPPSCTTDPMACPAADWEAEIRACLQTVRIPATAPFGAEILRRTDPEIADDVADIRTRYTALSPRAQSVGWFVYETQWACNRRVRELEIEYRFNVVLENRRGHPRWGENPPWPEVMAALEAVPEEHLSRRPGATQPMIFRRLDVHPRSAAGSGVGGETLDSRRGEIEVYNAGIGAAPYGRSALLGIPATSQTIRHEIGHSVEPLVDPAEKRRFQEQIVGWRDYSWHWINHPPTPICDPGHAPLQAEACELCRELGLLDAAGGCDAAALQGFLAQVATAEQVRGDRTYRRAEHFLTSVVTANVPSGREFEYARTGFGDYFAEVYAFALSAPEWLHGILPAAQTMWLKEHVFSTRSHYDQIIRPIVSRMGPTGIAYWLWAQLQFTEQQLLHVAARANRSLQPQP